MKPREFILLFFVIINIYSYCQKGNIVLTFTAKDTLTGNYLELESAYIKNLNEGCDTIIYGSIPSLVLNVAGVDENLLSNSEVLSILPNYPNPFKNITLFKINLKENRVVTIKLLNLLGKTLTEYQSYLCKGLHSFKLTTSIKNLMIINVSDGEINKTMKLINLTDDNVSFLNEITYLGINNELELLKKNKNVDFIFTVGDQLLIKASAIDYFDKIIYDSPTDTKLYTLDMKFDTTTVPTVFTGEITSITQNSAICGGNVTNNGGYPVTERGICWSTLTNPTIFNFHTLDGNGDGIFVSYLNNLSENTNYFIRAYATNTKGTAYGNEISFYTLQTTNVEGFVYFTGSQIPISGVAVSIDEVSCITNINGYYELQNIPIGEQTINASKLEFEPYSQNIEVIPTGLEFNIEMTSTVYAHKVFGTILNQISYPISNVEAVLLNPDGTESNLSGNSNSSGYYQLTNVPDGERTIRFIKESFETFEEVIIISNSDYQLDLELIEYKIPCPGFETVNYNGQIYNTVLIGTQCWFKENLNVGTKINSPQSQTDNQIIEKYCYDNNIINCDEWGALYQWEEAMQYSTSPGSQGICPNGWHIPTDYEWIVLANFLGGSEVAGGEMKEIGITHWNQPNTGATNSSGFTAIGAGNWDNVGAGSFQSMGDATTFWTSTQDGWYVSDSRRIFNFLINLSYGGASWTNGFSVRCLKN